MNVVATNSERASVVQKEIPDPESAMLPLSLTKLRKMPTRSAKRIIGGGGKRAVKPDGICFQMYIEEGCTKEL